MHRTLFVDLKQQQQKNKQKSSFLEHLSYWSVKSLHCFHYFFFFGVCAFETKSVCRRIVENKQMCGKCEI